jgi:ATP-binding cassette subfamily C protein
MSHLGSHCQNKGAGQCLSIDGDLVASVAVKVGLRNAAPHKQGECGRPHDRPI